MAATGPGIAISVPVRAGQSVEKGDLIVQLETDLLELEAQIARQRGAARGGIEAARARLNAANGLTTMLTKARAARAISQERLDEALKEEALARAELLQEEEAIALALAEAARIERQIERTSLLAPLAGVVGEELISVGEAARQTPVAQIYVIQPMRVEVFVPSAMLPDFIARSTHSIVTNTDSTRHDVTFDYVSPVADLSSDTISVYFTLENSSIRPGYRCQYVL